MAIYGIGAFHDGERDVSNAFIEQGVACLGWDEQQAPALYVALRRLQPGDLVYIKSHPRGRLIIKAVGVVEDGEVRRYGDLGHGVRVRWGWHGDPVIFDETPEERRYNVRNISLYEELSPMVRAEVLRLLFTAFREPGALTGTETHLGLALQRVYYRGMNWLAGETCESPNCPHRIAVNNLVGLAAEALAETGLEHAHVGRVGIISLRSTVSEAEPS
jgi:hypothetical protein